MTRVDIDTNAVTTINSTYFNGPKGIATTGSKVFVANTSYSPNGSIVMIDIATGAITNITDPRINNPIAVIWDGTHVVVADDTTSGAGLVFLDGNGTIVNATTDAAVQPYDYGFNSAISSDGTNVWVGSHAAGGTCGGHCLAKVTISTAAVSGVYTNANVNKPDVVLAAGGKVYMADDTNSSTVNVFDPVSTTFSILSNSVFNDMYSAVSDGSTVYFAQSYGCPSLQCIPTVSESNQTVGSFTNSTFQTLAASNYGALAYSRGCLWWVSADSNVTSPALLRICDAATPAPTTTTLPTTSTTADQLARTGDQSTILLSGAAGMLGLGVVASLATRRRRARRI